MLQQRAADIVLSDPAVFGVGSSIGSSDFNSSVNRGTLVHQPEAALGARHQREAVINRLRPKVADIPGLQRVHVRPAGRARRRPSGRFDLSVHALGSGLRRSSFTGRRSFSTSSRPGRSITDVSTDRQPGGLQANVVIDRTAAARLGVHIQDIDNALNDAFGQRQISTLFTQRNQYRVIMEIDPQYQRDPMDVSRIYVSSRERHAGAALGRDPGRARAAAAGDQPPGTVPGGHASASIWPRATRSTRPPHAVDRAVAELHMPDTMHAEYAGDARAYRDTVDGAAVADRRGADRGLHRAGRALREPRPSADDHLDAAVGRARRAAWRCRCSRPSCR